MTRKFALWCAVLAATLNSVAFAGGEPGDLSIRLNNSGTQLSVGAWDDAVGIDLGTQSPPVFGFDLGPSTPIPGVSIWSSGDPGHSSPGDTGELNDGQVLPVAVNLQQRLVPFGILGNPTQSNLWYWDGTTLNMGNPVFNPVVLADNLTLSMSHNSTTSAVSGGNFTSNFMSWGSRTPGGELHSHANTSIGQVGGILPNQGVYMVGSVFSMNGYADSPFTPMLFLAGFNDTVHDVALDWATANYASFTPAAIPEPGTWALLACSLVGGLVVGRRMRRRVAVVA